ncbi:MAG: hypothetical protein K8L99_12390 [Anaerolineae bacterium]|nr:hypothetical protein [Anaerolineae bacterium]
MARPTKLTKTIQNKLIKVIKTGATIKDACTYAGVGESTFYKWQSIGNAILEERDHEHMPEDEADKKRFVEFVEAVTRAQDTAKVTAVEAIFLAMKPYNETSTMKDTFTETRIDRKTGKPYEYVRVTERKTVTRRAGDWRAALEYLKRRHYDEWGDKSRFEHSGADGKPIPISIDLSEMSLEQLRTLADHLEDGDEETGQD